MQEGTLERRRDTASLLVNAQPHEIWRAFIQPDALMAWLPPHGMNGRALEYDFREGGRYRIELAYETSGCPSVGKTTASTDVTTGRFLLVDPGKRIVQTVKFESGDASFAGEMLMTWLLEPVAGGTRVTVIADNVPPGISQEDHAAGLRGSLENLSAHVDERRHT